MKYTPRLLLPLLALVAALLFGCASNEPSKPEDDGLDSYDVPLGDAESSFDATTSQSPLDMPIGFFLRYMDNIINAWVHHKFEAVGAREEMQRQFLEDSIRHYSIVRMDELIIQLQTGPPANRQVAAMALGFSGMPDAQGPLLSALSDTDPIVADNALLALGLLAMPDTPLAPICTVLSTSSNGLTRNNAAYAVLRIVGAGGRDAVVIDACRRGLTDIEGGVRVQCASVLGVLLDTESIDALGGLLQDDKGRVVAAAAHALGSIGKRSEQHYGECARLLVGSLDFLSPSEIERVVFELTVMSNRSYGDDIEDWREWARKLP